ncbi:3-hydroxy-3-methylglutaryl-coenzyme A (HMG-CoA) reductase isozyme [Tulasnella sp. 419]|nr:3-hydroxy-3-methylglutaryl-coenzyme A (HMG-CoA) reductase isozyme [Tulasnella sp. 419]
MVQALPAFLFTIGFHKPLLLARAVFSQPTISPASATSTSSLPMGAPTAKDEKQLKSRPIMESVREADQSTTTRVVRDRITEVAIIAVGAASGIAGLQEYSTLAALTVVADCLALWTFYVAVLNVTSQLHRIKNIIPSKRKPSTETASVHGPLPLRKKLSRTFLGDSTTSEKPVARFKILLFASFVILHLLNLVTTLISTATLRRHASPSLYSPALSSANDLVPYPIDISSSTISSLVQSLASTDPSSTHVTLRLAPPIRIPITLPAALQERLTHTSSILDISLTNDSIILQPLMDDWTSFADDSSVSRWVMVALVVSVFLNGYLLKAIGASPSPNQSAHTAPTLPHQEREPTSSKWVENCEKTEKSGLADLLALQERIKGAVKAPSLRIELPRKSLTIDSPFTGGFTMSIRPPNSLSTSRSDSPATTLAPNSLVNTPEISEIPLSRNYDECLTIFESGGVQSLSDEEVISLAQNGKIAAYALEKVLGDCTRAVKIRRALICE